ncbi:hypothetical protein FNW02_17630 [Komarekiella sp. 'clone 1']|uniref:Uncharacterized protein n=1 Tax=Komarekiella delphini-convector SJRDD-AB1 TaxID=2593771 RepID=A0AA40SYF7_9NOST|nr:hypothetical protein [Komarekiella delphini-convector]MBD6617599.1 hypothetical protein [Komarekiella delphini-convector SJRDD-AB1]
MKVSAIIKSICLLGLVGASNLLTAPANAGQGAARSAASVTRPSGVTESLAGEVLTPIGYFFQGIPAVPTIPAMPAIPGTKSYNVPGTGTLAVPPGAPTSTCGFSECYQPNPGDPFYTVFLVGGSPATPEIPGTPGATLTIAPTYANAGKTNESINGLSFNAGTPTAVNSVGTVAGVVVDILQSDNDGVKAPTIDGAAAIIKSAAGADGLE